MTNNTPTQYEKLPMAALGSGGPLVARMALGTMTFGAETNETTARCQLDLYTERGGNFIDTADVYSDGESERIVGRWLSSTDHRDNLIISTKGRFAPPAGSFGASRRALRIAVERSLQRLQIDAIDLYLVHGWDKRTPVTDTLEVLSDLVRDGKIHNIGWSNISGWQMQKIITTCDMGGYPRPVVLQPQYNLLDRGIEMELLPCCLESGVSITPWSPLGGGWLTGKYTYNHRPTGNNRLGENPERGVEAYEIRNNDATYRVLELLNIIANRHQKPMSQIALSWLLSRPAVASILLGARTTEQLQDNLDAASLQLCSDDLAQLTAVSATGIPPYPYGFLQNWSDMDVWKSLGC